MTHLYLCKLLLSFISFFFLCTFIQSIEHDTIVNNLEFEFPPMGSNDDVQTLGM